MKKITLYFATRNRLDFLSRTLDNIAYLCPESLVLVANCSSSDYKRETSEVLHSYENVKEIDYEKDPGMAESYSDLYEMVSETELSAVWADDVVFLKPIADLYSIFDDPNINLVALPMIDDISKAPSITVAWPKDAYGCAQWDTPTGRCAHHSIVRTNYFHKFGRVFTKELMIDNFFHMYTSKDQRVWPSDGPRILHTRIDDDTRFNTVMSGDCFRFPVGHPLRAGSQIQKASERK